MDTDRTAAERDGGGFLPDPTDVPWAVAAHLAAQLSISDPGVLKQYAAREGTNRLHAGEIQRAYGYRDFADPAVQQELLNWLEARTRLASERPSVLFDLATARLLEEVQRRAGAGLFGPGVAQLSEQPASPYRFRHRRGRLGGGVRRGGQGRGRAGNGDAEVGPAAAGGVHPQEVSWS